MPDRDLPRLLPRIGKRLEPAPVRQAICQIKHEALTIDPYTYGTLIQGDLAYEDMQPHSMQEFILLPTEAGLRPSTSEQKGIILRSPGWSVSVFANSFSLDCTAYERWENFLSRFQALLTSVMRHGGPRLISRVGVRFIDELVPPEGDPIPREERVDPSLAGILRHPHLGPRVDATTTMAQMREGRYGVTLRHGCDSISGANYMVDTDCYLDTGFAAAEDAVVDHVEALHDLASRVFRESLSVRYFAAIGGDADESPDLS